LWGQEQSLFGCGACVLADHLDESAFGTFAKLIVVGSLLADDNPPAPVPGIEPFTARGDLSVDAVNANARPHLDEGPALRKICRRFVFDPDKGGTLIPLQDAHSTQKDPVPRSRLADWPPICGGHYQADDQYGSDNCCDNDKNFLLHPRPAPCLLRPLLWAIETILSI
jgi:hypothetical protein